MTLSSGCSSNSAPQAQDAGTNGGQTFASGAGGAAGAGGIPGTSGQTGAGGVPNTGGSTAAGGVPGTGGSTAAGGVPNTGGSTGAGGVPNTGGSTGAGGIPNTGGSTRTGGVPGTGGAGGITSSGASGGVTSLGGSGGSTSSAGTSASGGSGGSASSGGSGGIATSGGAGGTRSSGGSGGSSAGSGGRGGSGGVSISGGTGGSGGSTSGGTGGRGNSGGSSGGSAGGAAGGSAGGSTAEVPLDPTLLSKCTGTNPIDCAFSAPNGNYVVTVELGSATAAATTRVRAETRRIVLQPTNTAAGAYFRFTFAVNVRAENHDGYSAPGNILNLSLDGTSPALHGVGFAAASIPTIFIAGDSTVCDWDPPTYNPATFLPSTDVSGWGQQLSQFLGPGIAVANYADSGETAGSFYTKFYPPAKAAMKQGDYLFVQFGHNDMKSDTAAQYQANLTKYLTDAKAKNVTPVLITPVARSGATAANHGFNGFDDNMRTLATAQNVALIDLTNLALTYYGTLSSSAKSALFVDGTHFHEPGATQIANLVAQAMKGLGNGLEAFVK